MENNGKPPEQVREQVREPLSVRPMDLFRAQDEARKIKLRMATSDGFENAISKLGLNQGNALSAGSYQFDLITRNRILLEMCYRGSWIAGAIIDAVSEDMTRAGASVTTSEAETQLEDFYAAVTRLQIWESLCTGTKWGRLYGGGIGVMDIAGQDLATPLDPDTVGKGQFRGIVVLDRWMLNPVMSPIIPFGPDMGLPMFYQIVSNPLAYDPSSQTADGDIYVHHSRVFRFGGIKLPFFQAITEQMWDESVLERLWDRLISFDNATLSAASLIDVANLRHVGIEGLREIIAAGGEALDGLMQQFEMMRLAQTNNRITLLDKNDEFGTTSYSFSGLPDTLLQFGQQLSGASQIPLVRLFGQSPAGLNSTGDADIRLYYDGIRSKQEGTLRRPLTKCFRVLWASEFGSPAPKDFQFTFNPLWQMSETDKANVAKTKTETISEAVSSLGVSPTTALKELRAQSKETGVFANITDEDIKEAELEPPPLPDVNPDAEQNPENSEPVREGVREPAKKTGDKKWWRRLLG